MNEIEQARAWAKQHIEQRQLQQLSDDTGQSYKMVWGFASGRTEHPKFDLVAAILAHKSLQDRRASKKKAV